MTDPRNFIILGFAVCGKLLVNGHYEVIVRLAGDPAFAMRAAQAIYEGFLDGQRDPEPSQAQSTRVLNRVIANIVRLYDTGTTERPS